MKKFQLLAAALFTSLTAAIAQTDIERTFTVGPAIGYGHTWIPNVGYSSLFKSSFNGGVTMNYSQWEHFGLAADVMYSLEGGKFKTSGDGTQIDVSLHYLRIPLKAAYFFGDVGNAFRPKITLGPSFGFLIDESTQVEGNRPSDSNLTGDHETIDLGGTASIGFNYRIRERIWLNTDAYYYMGLLETDNTEPLHHYNSNFGLRVGVAFGL